MDGDHNDDVPDLPPVPPTAGPAGPTIPTQWEVDANGNVKGPIFSFPSENLIVFDDVAITDPVELAKLRQPQRGQNA